jgi:hypothetical protein
MAEYTAADPELLLRGGVDLAQISEIIRRLEEQLEYTSYAKYYTAHGEDEITKMLDKMYLPSAEACREFIRMLKGLIVSHGQSVVDSGKVLSDADDVSTQAAGGKRG